MFKKKTNILFRLRGNRKEREEKRNGDKSDNVGQHIHITRSLIHSHIYTNLHPNKRVETKIALSLQLIYQMVQFGVFRCSFPGIGKTVKLKPLI